MTKEEKKKRGINFNIGTVIFGALFLYLIITIFIYATSRHISSYMVTSGTLSNNESYTALALRTETVVDASADGYVSYYVQDSAKASKSDIVCSISDSQDSASSAQTLTSSDMDKVRQLASQFAGSYNANRFSSVYDLQYSLNATVINSSDPSSVTGTACQASSDGIITYTTDGYESLTPDAVTSDDFNSKAYQGTELRTSDKVSAGNPIFRIATDDTWYLVFPLTDRQYEALKDKTTVRVRFNKDGTSENGDLAFFDKDNTHYAKVTLYSGLVRFADDRFLDIELVTNTETGLKIPLSSIVTKEFYTIPVEYLTTGGDEGAEGFMRQKTGKDGSTTTEFVETDIYEDTKNDSGQEVYYVDEADFDPGDIIVKPDSSETYTIQAVASLEGVYCTNRGYAQFRKINIMEQNDEYCLVKEGTTYGISQYDYIVRDGSSVNESEILR
ncbi:MAG: HlyD family efflux transporter periplasmic adaptor subunit [Bilifractor sp.]